MKTMKVIFWVSCLVMLMMICSDTAIGNEKNPIIVGVLENRHFAFAEMMRNSISMAMASIEAQGGINGRRLQLAYADDGGDRRMGLDAVRKLVREKKAVMLVGGYSSSNTLAMARAADDMNVPFLVCTAADDRITQHERRNIFRLNPPASEYAQGLEQLIEQKIRPGSMAIIYENSPFGTSGAKRMMRFCRKQDIEIRDIIPYHKERAAPGYFDRLLAPLKQNPPETIHLVSYKRDGVLMVQRIRAARITSHLMGGGGGFTHPEFIAETGNDAKFMMTATLWTADSKNPLAGRYAAQYRRKYKQIPDYHGAEAYSALLVAADALRRSKSMQARDIRHALAQTRMETAFGPVAFESYAHFERQNRQSTLVLQVHGGQYACVWPPELSVARLVLPVPQAPSVLGIEDASN